MNEYLDFFSSENITFCHSKATVLGHRQGTLGIQIQWRSEIWTCLDFEWLKRSWVEYGPDFDWDLNSGSPTI